MNKSRIHVGAAGGRNKKADQQRSAYLAYAEGEGFEPSIPLSGIPVFETGRFNHSRTLPDGRRQFHSKYTMNSRKLQRQEQEPNACSLEITRSIKSSRPRILFAASYPNRERRGNNPRTLSLSTTRSSADTRSFPGFQMK